MAKTLPKALCWTILGFIIATSIIASLSSHFYFNKERLGVILGITYIVSFMVFHFVFQGEGLIKVGVFALYPILTIVFCAAICMLFVVILAILKGG